MGGKPPRSDVLPKMVQALCVTLEDLIVGDEKSLKRNGLRVNDRPAGKVREIFERVSTLPRRKQEHIVNWGFRLRLPIRAKPAELATHKVFARFIKLREQRYELPAKAVMT